MSNELKKSGANDSIYQLFRRRRIIFLLGIRESAGNRPEICRESSRRFQFITIKDFVSWSSSPIQTRQGTMCPNLVSEAKDTSRIKTRKVPNGPRSNPSSSGSMFLMAPSPSTAHLKVIKKSLCLFRPQEDVGAPQKEVHEEGSVIIK